MAWRPWADPAMQLPRQVNTNHGGRGTHVDDPSVHRFEPITQPCGADLQRRVSHETLPLSRPASRLLAVLRVDDRLSELAEHWELPAGATAQLRQILDLVEAEPTSITTVRDPERGVDLHVADSLAGLAVPALRDAATIADLGAGGGFPGLALAAALPDARVTLVESVGKKCKFLRRTADAAGLTNVEIVNARAEAWWDGLGTQEVVTARALAPLNVVVEYAAPLLAEGGTLVAWKGRRDPSAEADGLAAAEIVGLEADPDPIPVVTSIHGADARHLYVYLKVRPTPDRFPRREGMARKRPLQASAEA
jgi:16S rRNA (guanine527-N7)-methyltransferase